MKKIAVQLNRKSIQNAINLLNLEKQKIEQAVHEYIELSADWIINRANEILDRSDIGEDVKSYIFKAWDTEWVGKNHLKIINHSRKSAYVEFGVGIIGKTASHPNATKTNWEYNLPTIHKDSQGGWVFSVRNMDELDIPQNSVLDFADVDENLAIYTKGTQGVWYLFNAMEDYKLLKQKSLWEQVKKKYWS